MNRLDILNILVHDIHSVVVGTVDDKGLPRTRVVDMMLHDEEAIYFLTAKGKSFHLFWEHKEYWNR